MSRRESIDHGSESGSHHDAAHVLAAIDAVAGSWAEERSDRLQRRHLDRADFDALAETGYLRLIVPEEHGGLWRSLNETGPIIVDAIHRLAGGDPSVALVASMHAGVLGFWTAAPAAPEPSREAWAAQRAEVFGTAIDGHFWGTVTSEPGSGGDILATRATATAVDDGATFALHGEKHFGSGSQIVSYMVTTAKPDGGGPMAFYLDLRDQPWDGTAGVRIVREWDGMGMKATQSHAVLLDGVIGFPWAWQGSLIESAPVTGTLSLAMYCSVIAAVCDAAMAEAERRLAGRSLRPYEDVSSTQAQIDHWMLTQAMRGLAATLSTEQAPVTLLAATKAKLGMAALAESLMSQICRAVGGGAFSASSPFASWYEDVRALGYLRPPWALAFDQLSASRADR